MKTKCFRLLLILQLISFSSYSQTKSEFSILFYNVENLFDTKDDPETSDEEFTPEGDRHWTNNRFQKKILNISKVILGSNEWNPPEMIGLCEVENHEVIERLIKDTPLKSIPYKIIHKHSPDSRGIDVAFVYNKDSFYPLNYKYYPIEISEGDFLKSREILYVTGIVNETDTLHLFFNHWPSRYSGLMRTQRLRIKAAQTLRKLVDDLFQKWNNPKIIIMGDFNDQPFDQSISENLIRNTTLDDVLPEELYNLSESWTEQPKGTIKYRTQWSVFDQIIVSGVLLDKNARVHTGKNSATIVDLPFIIEKDERYGGLKPARTYTGFNYNGGFSDHLPVLLRLNSTN